MSDNLEASSVIDQDEWQPALSEEWWTGQTRVKYFDGPLSGHWGLSNGAPQFILHDRDGVAFDEYERHVEKHDYSRDVDYVEYVWRRTVSKP